MKTYLLIFGFLITNFTFSQSLTAKVVDLNDNPIPFATVQTAENSGVITNEEGFFTINLEDVSSDSITFSCLGFASQTISIDDIKKNNNIVIPKTTIKTNILDINIAGEHSFDDKIDYHFSFGLRDVLIKNKHAEDFGPIKDDGLGKVLFLRVFGNLNDPQYEIDKSEKKAIRKEIRAEEKQNVKSILKDEFGLFKSDTSLHSKQKEVIEPTFEIENWEENDEKVDEILKKEEKKPKKEKKTPKWLKKLGVEDKKEPQQNISVEFDEDDI